MCIRDRLGTSLTAWLTYEYEWQYVYYFMMGLLLLCILRFCSVRLRTVAGGVLSGRLSGVQCSGT